MSFALKEFMADQDIETEEVCTVEELYQELMADDCVSMEEINWKLVAGVAAGAAAIGAGSYLLYKYLQKRKKRAEKEAKLMAAASKAITKEFQKSLDEMIAIDGMLLEDKSPEQASMEDMGIKKKIDYFSKVKIFLTNPLIFRGTYSPNKIRGVAVYDDVLFWNEDLIPRSCRVLMKQAELNVDWITAHPHQRWEGELDTRDLINNDWRTFGLRSTIDVFSNRLSANQDPICSTVPVKTSMVLGSVIDATTISAKGHMAALKTLEKFIDDIKKISHSLDRTYVIRTGEDRMAIVRGNISKVIDGATRHAEDLTKLSLNASRRQNELLIKGFRSIVEGQKNFINSQTPGFGTDAQHERLDRVLKHHKKIKAIVIKLEKAVLSGA